MYVYKPFDPLRESLSIIFGVQFFLPSKELTTNKIELSVDEFAG